MISAPADRHRPEGHRHEHPAGDSKPIYGRTGSSDVVEHLLNGDHEQVVCCYDPETGLRAVIALHSTALGPGLGGTRFYPYRSLQDAVVDVLRLSRSMSYKNALAGLAHGGGKAVIIGDPARDKTPQLLRAYGRFVQSLSGRYVTACDVGTYVTDMDVVAQTCDHVTGRSEANGGAGDSSVLTALGVFEGMRAASLYRWGSTDLTGRRIGIAGVGKVGHLLVDLSVEAGARPVVTDIDAAAVDRVSAQHPGVEVQLSNDALVAADLDVYAPCALGGALTEDVIARLSAGIICGAANNQLASPEVTDQITARAITYAPDYVVNCGGVIQVADELHGFSFSRARQRTLGVFDTTSMVLRTAQEHGITTAAAADRAAEHRMTSVPPGRRMWLPPPSDPRRRASPQRPAPTDS
ncbi:MAG: Glu/Leu/Phe/Val family dehydrogenase [Angustibacter sp.]